MHWICPRLLKEYYANLSGRYDENIKWVWDMQSTKFDAYVKGPKGSPYEGGIFRFEVTLP